MIYLLGMLIGIPANLFILSILDGPDQLSTIAASSMLLAAGVMFWSVTIVGDAAHGVLMFPVLKQHSERAAVGYLAARIMDATLIAVMALLILVQIPVAIEYANAAAADTSYLQALSAVFDHAQLYAYEFAMITVGAAGLILCYAFYRSQLIPRLLAGWGLIGYAVLLSGSVLQVFGFNLNSIQAIPGGLWEVFIGVWLIVKGFNSSSQAPSEPTRSSTTPVETPPLVFSDRP
ncbi:MAG TPA: DUF4386 domain-containing protein [Propionibacteriaceae bacterium]|nr:DUF4386 domain-containing protein [Propionibacteriaceae bacterium]